MEYFDKKMKAVRHPKGATYTDKHGDMRKYNGTTAVSARASNTRLSNVAATRNQPADSDSPKSETSFEREQRIFNEHWTAVREADPHYAKRMSGQLPPHPDSKAMKEHRAFLVEKAKRTINLHDDEDDERKVSTHWSRIYILVPLIYSLIFDSLRLSLLLRIDLRIFRQPKSRRLFGVANLRRLFAVASWTSVEEMHFIQRESPHLSVAQH